MMTVERVKITPTRILLKNASNEVVFDTNFKYVKTSQTTGAFEYSPTHPSPVLKYGTDMENMAGYIAANSRVNHVRRNSSDTATVDRILSKPLYPSVYRFRVGLALALYTTTAERGQTFRTNSYQGRTHKIMDVYKNGALQFSLYVKRAIGFNSHPFVPGVSSVTYVTADNGTLNTSLGSDQLVQVNYDDEIMVRSYKFPLSTRAESSPGSDIEFTYGSEPIYEGHSSYQFFLQIPFTVFVYTSNFIIPLEVTL